jgi:hypothetical protein
MLQFPKEPKNIRERIRGYERVLCKERETFAAQCRLPCNHFEIYLRIKG